MKKLLLVFCVLLIAPSISAQVWLPISIDFLNLESFRHQATQSINDDLDNGIDGTDIFAVNGARIYTNLSNLATGAELQGDNSYSANTVVIGATSPIYRGWKATAFYGNANYNDFSSSEYNMIYQWDSDANDIFDLEASSNSITSEGMYSPKNTILINLGKQLGEETEVAFTYRRSTGEDRAESDYATDSTLTDLTNDDILVSQETFGNGLSKLGAGASVYSLSYSKPFMNWKLRGDVIFMMGSENDNEDGLDYFFEDREPYDLTTTETELDSTIVDDKEDYSANLLGVNLRLSDENKYGVYWELGGNFGIIFGSGDYQDLSRGHNIYDYMIGTDIAEIDRLDLNSETGPISVSGNVMGINGRLEWQISENVRFGIGLMANSFSTTLEYDVDELYLDVTDYDDGDNEVDDPDDYVTTSVSGETYLYTVDASAKSIVIPAGVEVNFGKNKDWFMRLGALSTGLSMENTYTTDVISVHRDTTRTVWGDGASTEAIGPDVTYDDEEDIESYTSEGVDYFYGIGWKPSANLSIDLIGMFDLGGVELLSTDWLKSLKLSATINVY